MKLKILYGFREYIREVIPNRNTADSYYYAVQRLFYPIDFNNLSEIDTRWLQTELQKTKKKNEFSAVKNGLLYLEKYDHSLKLPDEKWFANVSKRKRNWTSRKKTINVDTVHRKVNAIQDTTLKYAFRLMEISGLRVSEVAALTKLDIKIDDNVITVHVRNGKGGKGRTVVCMDDQYLIDRLPAYLEKKSDNEKLFYAASTTKKKAHELDIECHNFRRLAAIKFRQIELKKPGTKVYAANGATQEFLGHERYSTTKRYLHNRKLEVTKLGK